MGDMIRAMGSQGQDPFAMLAQFAQVATSDAQASANVDPARRIALENLYRVAVLQTDGLNFLPPTFTAAAIPLEVHNPTSFARDTLNDWRPYLEALLQAMTPPTGGLFPTQNEGESGLPNEMFAMLSQFGSQLSPMLSGAQIGSLVGHFALDSMSGFEVVLPRGGHPRTVVVVNGLEKFASEWQLNQDALAMWLMVRELTMVSLLQVDHILDRFDTEIRLHLADMRADVANALGKLSTINLTDPAALQGILGDPTALISGELTPAQRLNAEDIEATLAVLIGVATFASREVGARVLGTEAVIEEAVLRRTLEPSDPRKMLAQMFGVEPSPHCLELAKGLADFLGEGENREILFDLYRDAENFPTTFDLENLSLWSARVHDGPDIPND